MQKRNSAISILRVMAMALIVFTHLCQLYNWVSIRSLIFGVPLFLCISGYLYGKRNITDWKRFYIGRIEKILLPVWIFSAFVMIYSTIFTKQTPDVFDVILQIFNLQGINNFLSFVPLFPFGDCAILWFMTIIMLCYFSIPFVQKLFNKTTSLFAVLFLFIVCALFQIIGINLLYFFIFWLGYYVAKRENYGFVNIKLVSTSFVVCVFLWGIRILLRRYIDGTIIYNKIIAALALDILAFFVFVLFLYLYPHMHKIFDSIAQSKVFSWFDSISIYVYMVHYLFFRGIWSVTSITSNVWLQTILIIVFTLPLSALFKIGNEFLQKLIFHSKSK